MSAKELSRHIQNYKKLVKECGTMYSYPVSRINEICSCGAVFEVTGMESFCEERYQQFLDAHEICREPDKHSGLKDDPQ